MHVHFLGIGGSGASAVANIALSNGYDVTGCDQNPFNEFTKNFSKNTLFQGHSSEHLKGVDILAVTPAIFSADSNNEEIKKAEELGIEVLTWQEFMGKYLEKDKFVIAICGTHGKSTTTAMIGEILEEQGLDPTVELGAVIPKWGTNFRVGKSKYFVTEADEFNNNFLVSHPDITVVLNIEMDHPEFFKDFESYKDSFYQFFLQTKQTIVGNLEDENVSELLKDLMKETKLSCFDFNKNVLNFSLKVIGKHNIKNAQAAFAVGIFLGISPEIIKKSLENFEGIKKRFEKLGKYREVTFYSDFAHHPTEIKITTEAIREKFPGKKIWIIFQPHMFSRTKYLFSDFVKVFKELPVDKITITDIYKARQSDIGDVTSEMFVEEVNKSNFEYTSENNLENEVKEKSQDFDLVVFMGAGVIDKIGRELVKQ